MYKVYEADGTTNCIVHSIQTAIEICRRHPGWTWEYVGNE